MMMQENQKYKVISVIIIAVIIALILNMVISLHDPKLGSDKPINENTKMELVEAIIEAKYQNGNEVMVNVRYGETVNNCTFKGIEGFLIGLRSPGDTIPMYLNTYYDKNGIPQARWLNMGN